MAKLRDLHDVSVVYIKRGKSETGKKKSLHTHTLTTSHLWPSLQHLSAHTLTIHYFVKHTRFFLVYTTPKIAGMDKLYILHKQLSFSRGITLHFIEFSLLFFITEMMIKFYYFIREFWVLKKIFKDMQFLTISSLARIY